MDYRKVEALKKLTEEIGKRKRFIDAKEKMLNEKEANLRQDVVMNRGSKDLLTNMRRVLDPEIVPGNVGDINRIIWPFFFTTDPTGSIVPNQSFTTGFNITQEAAFIWMSFTKTVYTEDTDELTYVDPEQPGQTGLTPGLSMSIRDGLSQRDFQNFSFDMDMVGLPNFPTVLPRPMLVLPNGTMKLNFVNSSVDTNYQPFITAFGYRCRIDDAQNILSLIYK